MFQLIAEIENILLIYRMFIDIIEYSEAFCNCTQHPIIQNFVESTVVTKEVLCIVYCDILKILYCQKQFPVVLLARRTYEYLN